MPGIILPNLTFIHLPRTGGTSIGHWLYQNSSDANLAKLDHVHKRYSDQVASKDTTTFAVVRNPWDRMVSLCYFMEGWLKKREDRPQWQNLRTQLKKYADFKSFIKDIKNLDPIDYTHNPDVNFNFSLIQQQTWWLDGPVTHVLRFEKLEEDFKIIQNITNCYLPLPKENTSVHADYRTYYDDESRELVATWFADDIKQLGYEF